MVRNVALCFCKRQTHSSPQILARLDPKFIYVTRKNIVVARKLLTLGIYPLNHLGIFPSLYSYDLTSMPQLLGTTSICSLLLKLGKPYLYDDHINNTSLGI